MLKTPKFCWYRSEVLQQEDTGWMFSQDDCWLLLDCSQIDVLPVQLNRFSPWVTAEPQKWLWSRISKVYIWLVVWNIFYFPIYWVSNHPNWWNHIFQRGGPTTNQIWSLFMFWVFRMVKKHKVTNHWQGFSPTIVRGRFSFLMFTNNILFWPRLDFHVECFIRVFFREIHGQKPWVPHRCGSVLASASPSPWPRRNGPKTWCPWMLVCKVAVIREVHGWWFSEDSSIVWMVCISILIDHYQHYMLDGSLYSSTSRGLAATAQVAVAFSNCKSITWHCRELGVVAAPGKLHKFPPTMWGPPVVSWSVNPIKYTYKYHEP